MASPRGHFPQNAPPTALLRDVEDLEKEFPDNEEVSMFTAVVIPLLSSAIKLRKQPIDDVKFTLRPLVYALKYKLPWINRLGIWVSGAFKTSFEITNTGYTLVGRQKCSCGQQLG